MSPTFTTRAEHPDDRGTVARVVQRAYADVPHSDRHEHVMVERLRRTDAFVPALSILAERGGDTVGHILLTRASIRSAQAAKEVLALAPLSVVPEFRGQGVGWLLVRAALGRAADLGFGVVVLVGIPRYYDQFGFEPLGRYPITLPFAAPDDICKVLALRPHALDGLAGTVRYADGWLDH